MNILHVEAYIWHFGYCKMVCVNMIIVLDVGKYSMMYLTLHAIERGTRVMAPFLLFGCWFWLLGLFYTKLISLKNIWQNL